MTAEEVGAPSGTPGGPGLRPRLVVTGHTAEGTATVTTDDHLEPVTADALPGSEFYLLWGTPAGVAPTLDEAAPPVTLPFFAGPGGSRFLLARYPPESPSRVAEPAPPPDPAAQERLVAALPGLIDVFESPDSPMHTTDTLDYAVCLEGELSLLIGDDEVVLTPGTCVVQRGTRHGWRNRSSTTSALMCFVGIGAGRTDAPRDGGTPPSPTPHHQRSTMQIVVDDLSGPEIASFLEQHIADMQSVSPPESKHALDLEGLRQPEITFWTVWEGEELVGCGAIKELDADQCEIKSMRTQPSLKRQGIASSLLKYVIGVARERDYREIYLETGSMDFFEPARQLYLKHGFEFCEPFGEYQKDPNSVHMRLAL